MRLMVLALLLLTLASAVFASESVIVRDDLNGKTIVKAVGISYDGDAALLDAPGDTIEYPAEDFATRAGRIEFDFKLLKPLNANHPAWCIFSDIGAGSSHWGAINVHWREGSGKLEYGIFDGSAHHWCYSRTTDWQVGRWYHLGLQYGPDGMRLDVDRKTEATNPYTDGLSKTSKRIGWEDPWFHTPPVAVRNFRTYRVNTDSIDISPALVCPFKDGLFDSCTVTYGVAEASTVTIDVLAPDGKQAARLVDHIPTGPGEYHIIWDGGGLPDGEYTVAVRSESKSGTAETKDRVRIDSQWKWKKPKPAFRDFFPMAMYYFCEDDATYINRHIDDPAKARAYYERTIKDLADHGINMIILAWTPKDHQRMVLDIAQKYGIKVIANLDAIIHFIGNSQADKENPFDIALDAVKDIKDHPALAGYYIIDEPSNKPEVAKRILLAKHVLEAVDPKHPSFSCLLGGYEDLLKTVDYQVLLIDIYPLGLNWNGDFSGYTSQVDRGRLNAGDRPLWVITQVFGKPKVWKIPTPEEIRAEVWLALAHGANGIHYFIYQSTTGYQGEWLEGLVDMDLKQMDSRWDEIGKINSDLKKLAPTILKLKPANFLIPAKSDKVTIKGFVDSSGKRYVILANPDTRNPAEVEWSGKAVDVLTGAEITGTVTLEPGGGKLVRLG